MCTALRYLKDISVEGGGSGSQHIEMSPAPVKVSNFSQPISGLELTVVMIKSSRDRMTMEKLILLQYHSVS